MMQPVDIITLANLPGTGRRAVKFMYDTFREKVSTEKDLLNVIKAARVLRPRIKVPGIDDIIRAKEKALETISKAEEKGIYILHPENPDFPDALKEIPDPPVILYVRGDVLALKVCASAAVIGTKSPTGFGSASASRVSRKLTEAGFAIVSGLAMGCDTAAHEACLNSSGVTIAALPSGVNNIYPTDNISLADRIAENGGCLVSEYGIDASPAPNTFIERDRLQSGLSLGVIVAETGLKGGTMHTVNYARAQHKLIACIDGHPEEFARYPSVEGNKVLITQGAFVLKTEKDIEQLIEELKKRQTGSFRDIIEKI